uniref:Protein kinase domain-containing protein n=1 Tax=Panagrellus redivivus TaxID=6233 RepID=A0A7E4URF8_PANRE
MTPKIPNFDLRVYNRGKELARDRVYLYNLDDRVANVVPDFPDEVIVKKPFIIDEIGRARLEKLQNRNHENIVKVIDVIDRIVQYHEPRLQAIIFEYCNGGDLQKANFISKDQFFKWTFEIAEGLAWLHANDMVHGDVKPLNVFLKDGIAKIGDIDDIFTTGTLSKRTPAYTASDRQNPPTKACDVYSFAKTVETLWDKVDDKGDGSIDGFLENYLKPNRSERLSMGDFVQSRQQLQYFLDGGGDLPDF